MICVAPIHLAVYTNGDCACLLLSLLSLHHQLTYTAKRIGEMSPADDSHGWIFAQLSTIDDVTKYRGISVSRYLFRRYIIVGVS